MATRILHCGKSIENYHLCITEKVCGFTKRIAKEGDTIYIVVRKDKETVCGARAVLSSITDYKPWEDADRYVQCFMLKDIEFCSPFDISILSRVGGQHWGVKFTQASKEIKMQEAVDLLNRTFEMNRVEEYLPFSGSEAQVNDSEVEDDSELFDGESEDEEITIMGTFQTIKFLNETDKNRGLEPLVNRNFYQLFPQFAERRSLLIPDNRGFITAGVDNISGIRGVPDALLLVYNKDQKVPLQVNLVEYECYGEQKVRSLEKFNYLNGHIIPQLMRFASNFSVVTDKQIRQQTIKNWTQKVVDYVSDDDEMCARVFPWLEELFPGLKQHKMSLALQNLLFDSFQSNLRVMLVIDELTDEQRETIKNIINSFKLESGKEIAFAGYTVRLGQRINITDQDAEFALSVQ